MQARFQAGPVPEFYASGLDHIEAMGGVSRQVWVSERMVGGKVLYVPAFHFISPNVAIPDAIRKMLRLLSADAIAALQIGGRVH